MPRSGRKWVAFCAGLLAFAAFVALDTPLSDWDRYGARPALAAGLTAWMAIWWITEAVPIQWTACLPLLVLPWSDVYGEGVAPNLRGALLPKAPPPRAPSPATVRHIIDELGDDPDRLRRIMGRPEPLWDLREVLHRFQSAGAEASAAQRSG